jgi:hypothetical protein
VVKETIAMRSGVQYTHLSGFRLTQRDAQMDAVLAWMRELLGVLESIPALRARAAQARPTTSIEAEDENSAT